MNDSRWIKWFAIATAVLTASLVFFDHRPGEICFAPGHANRRTGCVPASYSTFKSDVGPIPNPNSHRFACTYSYTHNYPERYAFPKSSPCASGSPASTPSPIASRTFAFIAGSVLCVPLRSYGSGRP